MIDSFMQVVFSLITLWVMVIGIAIIIDRNRLVRPVIEWPLRLGRHGLRLAWRLARWVVGNLLIHLGEWIRGNRRGGGNNQQNNRGG